MNELLNLSARHLREAAQLRERIDSLQRQLQRLLGGGSSAAAASSPARPTGSSKAKRGARGRRRSMSSATKARLAAIARARWKAAKAAGKHAL